MSYPRIVHAVFHSPWAIQRAWLGTIFSLLHSRVFADGAKVELPTEADAWRAEMAAARNGAMRRGHVSLQRFGKQGGRLVNHTARIHAKALKQCGDSYTRYYQIVEEEEAALPAGQIAHVFGSGVMGKHISAMEELCAGGLSVDKIQMALKLVRDDEKCAGVMLHLDTPGGISYGCAETAALVRQLAESKVVGAFCDSMCCSAGYWATCLADAYYLTPSADVGSVGVYCAIIDYSEWCAKEGIKVDLIKDGTHKGAGFPGTSLTPEQRALIEADVMECSRMFKADVRERRTKASDDTLQGQSIGGQKAIEAGLADAMVNDLDAALSDLATTI